MAFFVSFQKCEPELIFRFIWADDKSHANIVATDGSQGWVTTLLPSHKSRVFDKKADKEFLDDVCAAIQFQDETKYGFEIAQSADRRVIHFTVKVRPPGSAIAVNLCKLELSVVEAPDGIIREFMKQLINSVNSAHREQEKQKSLFADLRQQCQSAQALVRSVIDVQKAEEGALMGQFVEVLNSKKDEIERLRQEILRLNEKLEAERVGLGRVPSLVPTPAAARLRAGSDDSALDSDLRDSSDDERSVLPPNPAVATLPLASLESAYQPVLRAAHAPPRGRITAAAPRLPARAPTDELDAAMEEDELAGASRPVKPRAFGAAAKRRAPVSVELESQATVGSQISTQGKLRRTLGRSASLASHHSVE